MQDYLIDRDKYWGISKVLLSFLYARDGFSEFSRLRKERLEKIRKGRQVGQGSVGKSKEI